MAVQRTAQRTGTDARVDGTTGYSRALERDATRNHNSDVAAKAADRRMARTAGRMGLRVAAARKALKGRSYVDTIAIIDSVNPMDRDVYLIAVQEDAKPFATHVLRRFGAIRKSVLARYRDESGVQAPDSPGDGA